MIGKTTAQTFAKNIYSYRKQRGLSQYDLAEKTGISRRMISHYETDGILPPVDRLEILAQVLEIPVAALFEQDSPRKQTAVDLSGIDSRSVKKLKDILSLSHEDRNDLYRILNKMLRKNQLEQQESHSRV